MVLRVEVRFIDESDFVNKRKGFIVKDNPDWEIDFSISLDLADSLLPGGNEFHRQRFCW